LTTVAAPADLLVEMVATGDCATRHGEGSPSVDAFAQLLVEQLTTDGPARLKGLDLSAP